jgi:hypothetical protein
MKGRDHLQDLGADGRIILNGIKEMEWVGVDRIHVAQDRAYCRLL